MSSSNTPQKKKFSRIGRHTRKSCIHFEDLRGCRHKGDGKSMGGTSRGLGCAVAAPGAVFGRPRSIGHYALAVENEE